MEHHIQLPGGAYFDGARIMAPLAKMKAYDDNPRDPRDFDYALSTDFRSLVASIDRVGITNPLQAFWKDGFFQILAGHRRKAAAEEVNLQRTDVWEKAGRPGPVPALIDVVPVTLQTAPESEYERQVAMWNAEETKAGWPEPRRFAFFCATIEAAPPPLKSDVSELAKVLGMKPSTVRTYIEIMIIPELKVAMADPSEIRLPRAGRHKTVRALARLTRDLVANRPNVVRVATSLEPAHERAQDVVAAKLISKYQIYAQSTQLGVGPGIALERTVPLIDPAFETPVSDAELISWLSDANVLRQDVIERRAARPEPDGGDGQSVLAKVKGIGLRVRPGYMDEDDLQAYVDDVTLAADYLAAEARKARVALQNKRGR